MSASPLSPSPDWTDPDAARAWLQLCFDAFAVGMLAVDASGRVRLANAAAHTILGVPLSAPLHDIAPCLQSGDLAKFQERCARVTDKESSGPPREDLFLSGGGARCRVKCSFTALPAQHSGRQLALVTLTDAAEQEQDELSERRYRALFDAAADAMIVVSPQGVLLDLNQTVCEQVDMPREALVGKNVALLFTEAGQQFVLSALEDISTQGVRHTFEALLTSPDSPIPVEINARLIEFQGQPAVLCIARDITERRLLQARLEYQASTDTLTTLNNRRHFLLKADQEFQRLKRYGNSFAMLMLDLDCFKQINDTYGHQIGDAVLRDFAGRMRATFRHSDVLGRIGGEEFSVLLLESSLHRGIETAERLRQQTAKVPLQTGHATVSYTVSIGVTSAGADDNNLDAVMRRADAALYLAKRNGRNRVECENGKSRS